jgi:hypothetical protein
MDNEVRLLIYGRRYIVMEGFVGFADVVFLLLVQQHAGAGYMGSVEIVVKVKEKYKLKCDTLQPNLPLRVFSIAS